FVFFFQAEDGIRDLIVTGVQTCALPICRAVQRGGRLADRVAVRRVAHRLERGEGGLDAVALGRVDERRALAQRPLDVGDHGVRRSEERRVGKEWRSRRSREAWKKKRRME